jgi:hypothetical protein
VDAPRFQDDQMATSSLILAHSIDPVPARQVGTGMFILGDLKVLPSVRKEFYRDSDLGYWMQVYNLETDESTSLPSASVQTTITRDGREMARITDGSERLAGGGRQMTLHREIPLAEFEPGRYTIQVRVIDDISGNVQVQTDDFVVMERPAV